MKSYFLIVLAVINNLKLSHCSNETNETSLEISLGLCMTKFPLNITTFDFYFDFTNRSSQSNNNKASTFYDNESNDSDLCSINCCTDTNARKRLIYNYLTLKFRFILSYYYFRL